MNFDLPPEVGKAVPGVLGSLVALRWMKQPTKLGTLFVFLSGCIVSRFTAGPVGLWLNLDAGLAGFLMGLFGMAVVAGVFDYINSNAISSTINEWVRLRLGLPPKEGR